MVDKFLLQELRALGVQSATLDSGRILSVTFFPPSVVAASGQDAVVEAEAARIAERLEPAKARALRAQLAAEADPDRQTQIADALAKVLDEDLRYGHA